jgi:hypothetical protein
MNTATDVNFKPPGYYTLLRRIQVLVAGGIVGISAWLIHGAFTDELTFALICVRV